ncbi:MAG TPA: hypothetical protein VII63_13165 [Caulobacteraceae bacterium]
MTEADVLERKAAYIDVVRALHRRTRNLGFVACLAGVLILVFAKFVAGSPPLLLWAGLGVVLLGWGLFAWSVVQRIAWVRAHPFVAKD